MKRTYVLLNRILGNTDKRFDDSVIWELIVPIKNDDGTFSLPSQANDKWAMDTFKKYLLKGETVLVNNMGGWNTLLKTDHILKIWQK